MYCMNCGAEIENGTDICPVCHALLKSEDVLGDNYANYIQQEQTVLNSANKSTEKIHKRKKWGIGKKLLLTAGIFVIAVVILFVWFLKSPARQVISYVKSDKYERAYDTYSDDVKGNSVQEFLLKKLLEHELANIDKDYSEGKLEFDSVIGRINIIISLDIKEIDKIIEDKVVSIGAKIKDEYETQAAEYEISMLRLDDLSSLCMSENVQDKLSIMIADVQTLKESRDAYADAEKQYQSGNYDAALEKYALVSESDDNYEDAQGKIAECADSYRNKIIEQVASPESYDDYEYSISLVKIALGVLPEDQELGDRLTALTSEYAALLKGDALDKGTEYINSGNYADAFDLINKALEYNEGDTELTSFLASSQSSYESYITEQVNGFTASYDYDKAIFVLDTALSVLPESTVLLGLKEETENNKPVKLCDMKIAES